MLHDVAHLAEALEAVVLGGQRRAATPPVISTKPGRAAVIRLRDSTHPHCVRPAPSLGRDPRAGRTFVVTERGAKNKT